MPHDLVIRGGEVHDGTGAPGRRADVAVDGGIITEVGVVDGRGRTELDAEGHVVSPGFIDAHTHMDAQVFWDPLGSSSCWHGVTTVVTGNCGFTLAPVRASERELVVRNLERAEDIAPEALAAGIDWSWESFPEYLDAVERLPKALNVAAYIGHSALRTWAMGEQAFERAATGDEIDTMAREVHLALEAGAIGFTTSRSRNHETSDDRPVASRAADWSEVCRLVAALSSAPGAVFELAVEPAFGDPDPDVRAEAATRLGTLAAATGVPITFGVAAPDPQTATLLELIERTNAAGSRMFGQSHSRGISVIMSFGGHLPFDVLPDWRAVRSLSLDEQLNALRDDVTRARLRDAAVCGEYPRGIGAELPPPDYERMRVLRDAVAPNPSVAEIAVQRGVHPVDAILDLAVESGLAQLFAQPLTPLEPDDLARIMRHPNTVMTFSDSGAHVSQISDASIQTYLLAYWVRARQEFTLAEAIRMITSVPAAAWGMADRGRVAPGLRADLNVFDADRIAPVLPEVANDLPAGARRLRQRSTGILATIVGGVPTFRDGEHTGAFAGRLIRRGRG
ncbi:MAG: N-acyl-D-amino-acid deacylase [Pseudonocardiales bacterium]|jgi:N-acyl-D-aspartate/D-glutamate deacylase|nr:N-acyl-D-amino-acid deacylase [Pseudonocardiales bacterium]